MRIRDRVSWTETSLANAGVTIIHGFAELQDTHTVNITSTDPGTPSPATKAAGPRDVASAPGDGGRHETPTTMTGRVIVLANGSEPLFFPDVRPDGRRIIAPRHTQHLSELPESMIMVGGGVTGVEYATAFARMGTRVTLLSATPLLPRSDREYVKRLEDHMRQLGVDVHVGVTVDHVAPGDNEVHVRDGAGAFRSASYAFIATGRTADLTFLSETAPQIGRTPDGRFLSVDASGRTDVPGIYACGDITGPPLTANKAMHQARAVAASILSLGEPGPVPALIEAVYTQPQLAQVGPVLDLAADPSLHLYRRPFGDLLLSLVHGDADSGELKVWIDQGGMIRGAAAFGEAAAEVLSPIQLAMTWNIPYDRLQEVPFAHPTMSEVVTL